MRPLRTNQEENLDENKNENPKPIGPENRSLHSQQSGKSVKIERAREESDQRRLDASAMLLCVVRAYQEGSDVHWLLRR